MKISSVRRILTITTKTFLKARMYPILQILVKHKYAVIIYAFLTYCFASIKQLRYFSQAADGASYIGLINSARSGFRLDPTLYASILRINESAYIGSEGWCASESVFSVTEKSSVFQWHAYLIAYPLGWISRVTSLKPSLVAALAESLALGGVVIIATFILWKATKNMALVSLLAIFLLCNPILRIGFMGQLQPERLLLFPTVLLLVQIEKHVNFHRYSKIVVILTYVIGTSISERSAFTLAWLTMAYIALRAPKSLLKEPHKNLFFWCALLSFGWWLYWTKMLEDSIYYKQISFKGVLSGLEISFTDDLSNTIRMLVVLIPLIALSLFRWQGTVVGVISLIPNLAVSVGGAEKTSYYTHYHATYLAVFFAAAVLGVLRISQLLEKRSAEPVKLKNQSRIFGIVLIAALFYSLSYSENKLFSPRSVMQNMVATAESYGLNFGAYRMHLGTASQEWQKIADEISMGSRISAPEWIMPALTHEGHSKVSYYPIGVTTADVIFAEYDESSGQLNFLPWLLESTESTKIGSCIASAVENRTEDFRKELVKSNLMRFSFVTNS